MLSFNLWLESKKVNEYLGDTGKKVEDWLLRQSEIQEFLKKIDQINLIKPKIGEKGLLVLAKSQQFEPFTNHKYYDDFTGNAFQHRIPIIILNLKGSEAEIARTDGKSFAELSYKAPYFPNPKEKNTIIVPLNRISIVKPEQYQKYLKWITYAVIEGAKRENTSIPKYFRLNWHKVENQLLQSLPNQQMQSKFKTTDLNFSHFMQRYVNPSNDLRGGFGDNGRVILSFPNGFKWLSLDREACRKEGDAGGHCGNTADPNPGDNILSLRGPNNRVYLTFVVNNGVLGERKANGNKKPSEQLHDYIVDLLKDPIIKKIGSGRYLTYNDFEISDLSYDKMIELAKARPDLIKVNKIDLAFSKYNNISKVIEKIESKYPNIKNITGYDKLDKALIIGHGDYLNDVKGAENIQAALEFKNNSYSYELQEMLDNIVLDLPTSSINQIYEYFKSKDPSIKNVPISQLQNEEKPYFINIFYQFFNQDKIFKAFIQKSIKEASEKTNIDYINDKLKYDNDSIYYKLYKRNIYYYLYTQLKTNNIKKYDPTQKPIIPRYINQIDPSIGYLVEAINNNLRMLTYI